MGAMPSDEVPDGGGRRGGAASDGAGGAGVGPAGAGGDGEPWLDVRATVVERGFEASLRVWPGEVVAVLGPNGAGKSTLLSVIAGLVAVDRGRVRAGDRVLMDTSVGVSVPVAQRRVGLLAQDALLFSSLSAAENVEFGPRSQGMGKAESSALAVRRLREVGAADLARRKPRKLSGGQAQRVAIARALAAGPEVLLLDEPMAALDVAVAARVRSMLRGVLRERAEESGGRCATVIVTHDLVDALTLADRIVVLDNGVVADEGPVDRVVRSPRSVFAADLAGSNMVVGTADGAGDGAAGAGAGTADAGGDAGGQVHGRGFAAAFRRGRRSRSAGSGTGADPGPAVPQPVEADADAAPATIRTAAGAHVHGRTLHAIGADERAVAVFSPRAVAVYRTRPQGSPRNVFDVRVTAVEARGDAIRLRAHCERVGDLMAETTTAGARELGLEAGEAAVFVVKASEVRVYPS